MLTAKVGYRSFPALHIILGDESTLLYSTLNETFEDDTYVNRLSKVGNLKQSLTKSVDRVAVEIDNGDLLPGRALTDEARTGALLTATVYRIYVSNDGLESYRVERAHGVLRVPQSTDRLVLCDFITDTYAAGSIFGDYEVRRTCVWRYRDTDTCGYDGELPTCSLTFDGTNGCVTHFVTEEEAKMHFGGHGLFIDETARNSQLPTLGDPSGDIESPFNLPNGGMGGMVSNALRRLRERSPHLFE